MTIELKRRWLAAMEGRASAYLLNAAYAAIQEGESIEAIDDALRRVSMDARERLILSAAPAPIDAERGAGVSSN